MGLTIRIWFVGQDNSQSCSQNILWKKKYVIDSNHNNTEIPADPHELSDATNKYQGCCSQIKGKNKTTTEGTC